MKRYLAIAVVALAPLACAQTLKLSVFDKLKDKATDSTDLNLSKDLLGLAGGFLGSDKDGDGAKVKKLVSGLNNILIKSLTFDKEMVYASADVQQLISELGGPGWKLVISSDEKHGNGQEISRVWTKAMADGEIGGLRIMSAEPKELSVIEITGRVNLKDLHELGDLGIPNLDIGKLHTGSSSKKNDE
jgi:hypothetical protein